MREVGLGARLIAKHAERRNNRVGRGVEVSQQRVAIFGTKQIEFQNTHIRLVTHAQIRRIAFASVRIANGKDDIPSLRCVFRGNCTADIRCAAQQQHRLS